MEICAKENCTGCLACKNACPTQCITTTKDGLGHLYPLVNETMCIKCQRCVNICPGNIDVKTNKPTECYAAWSQEDTDRLTSSSGGVSSVLVKGIISKNGVVYGAVYDNGFVTARFDNLEDSLKLKGSKYVQCSVENTYNEVKSDLSEDKLVLYTGLPCQIAGLKAFLGREYDNLYTVDLICHGVPSEAMLYNHIEKLTGISKDKISNITFREKSEWKLNVYGSDKMILSVNSSNDLYYKSFLEALTYRDNCYVCKYANSDRVGDITIGDFWGLGNKDDFEYDVNNVSAVLINTLKGKELLELCKENMSMHKRDVKEAIDGNHQLREPSRKNKETDLFRKKYVLVGFDKAVSATKIGKNIKKNMYKQAILRHIPKCLKEKRKLYKYSSKI